MSEQRKQWERDTQDIDNTEGDYQDYENDGQGVIFPAGVRVFPAGNLQNPQEILTRTLIIEQIL